MTTHSRVIEIFRSLGSDVNLETLQGLKVTTPWTGENVAHIPLDDTASLNEKVARAKAAQQRFSSLPRRGRVKLVETYAKALKDNQQHLADIIHIEAGKTPKEAAGEAGASADVLLKAIADTTLPDVGAIQRIKERPPAGIVGLITSFNFPMVVAHWTAGAAFIAGNGIIWKPSEKTPLSALACKAVFDKALPAFADLLQVAIGDRHAVGGPMVAHEDVDIISATGSVGMGKGIQQTLSDKKNNTLHPILELGGNNGVIIGEHVTPEHIAWSVAAIMQSFLGTTGQRCTNTRRIIVHASKLGEVVATFKNEIENFLSQYSTGDGFDRANSFGYGALIDSIEFGNFEHAKQQATEEGGTVLFGNRLHTEKFPNAFYVEPALVLMPQQTPVMHTETFAPLLYVVPYEGALQNGLALMNAPENAGLVAGIYTLSQQEADEFAAHCEAGHALINSPKGTGTPAYGMGFGGNKDSGCGEILNSADPLAAFTRPGKFTRIALNKEIVLQA
ncbi:MAG: aldehyde dehydrogenase [Alphaproteobacteria bacterium]